MALKFFKRGNLWIYQGHGAELAEEISVTSGYYKRVIDGNIISIVGINTDTNVLIKEELVTDIVKNDNGDYYESILDFIALTEPFFVSQSVSSGTDYANRTSMNSVFGEKYVGHRKVNVASQFQYGFPQDDANSSIVGSGNIGISESMLYVQTGTDTNGYASISNKKALRYIPGHEAYMYFTAAFTDGVANSYQRGGIFDDSNGFFVGFEGSQFCVSRRRSGVDYNHQIDVTKVFSDGSFDPTKGNIYKISFGYLGFANISFEVLSPKGNWVVMYSIEYAGKNIETHITNTNLQPRMEIGNTGNNTDLTLKTGSFSAGVVDGGSASDPLARMFAKSLPSLTISAGDFHIITFRNKDIFNGIKNYIESSLRLLSLSTDLSKNSIVSFRKNVTITNSPTWVDVDTANSIHDYAQDVTFSGGTEVFSIALAKVSTFFEDMYDQRIELLPNETMTISIYTPLGTSGTIDLSLRWAELF